MSKQKKRKQWLQHQHHWLALSVSRKQTRVKKAKQPRPPRSDRIDDNDFRSTIVDIQSLIFDPQSPILDPRSSILNRRSSIVDPLSSTLYLRPSILDPQSPTLKSSSSIDTLDIAAIDSPVRSCPVGSAASAWSASPPLPPCAAVLPLAHFLHPIEPVLLVGVVVLHPKRAGNWKSIAMVLRATGWVGLEWPAKAPGRAQSETRSGIRDRDRDQGRGRTAISDGADDDHTVCCSRSID